MNKPAIEGEIVEASAISEYRATEAGLAQLREQYGTVPDVTTKDGMLAAREARRDCVSLRTAIESKRQELKAPLLKQGRLLDDEAKRITAEIAKVESPIDEAIKAEEAKVEKRREEARQKREAEQAASRAIIDEIRDLPLQYLVADPEDLRKAMDTLADRNLDDEGALLPDDLDEARRARDTSLERLENMLEARVEADRIQAEQQAEAQRLAEERKQAERERAEQAQRDAADRKRRDEIDGRMRALAHIGLGLTGSRDIRSARDTLLTAEIDEATFGDRLAEAEAAYDEAKVRLEKQLDAALTQERIAAEQAERQRQLDAEEARQAQVRADAERERQESAEKAESERLAREQAAAAEREQARLAAEQAAIDKATLVEAGRMALALLREVGHAEHVTTRMLAAAIDRAENPAKAAPRKRKANQEPQA